MLRGDNSLFEARWIHINPFGTLVNAQKSNICNIAYNWVAKNTP
jgi:hypothetical protein